MFLTVVSVPYGLHWSPSTGCTRALTTENQSYTSASPFLFFAEGSRSVKQEALVWTAYFIALNWFRYFQDNTVQYLLIHDMQKFLSLSAIIKLNTYFFAFWHHNRKWRDTNILLQSAYSTLSMHKDVEQTVNPLLPKNIFFKFLMRNFYSQYFFFRTLIAKLSHDTYMFDIGLFWNLQ